MRCDLRSVCLRRVTKSASFFAVQLWRSRPVTRFTTFAAPERCTCSVEALGANPVREKIWPRRFPQSIITTLRNVTKIETALVDLFWAHLPY